MTAKSAIFLLKDLFQVAHGTTASIATAENCLPHIYAVENYYIVHPVSPFKVYSTHTHQWTAGGAAEGCELIREGDLLVEARLPTPRRLLSLC